MPRLLAALALLLAAVAVATSALGQTLNITPRPLVGEMRPGAAITLTNGDPVVVARGDVGARRVARYLADLVLKTRGLRFATAARASRDRKSVV